MALNQLDQTPSSWERQKLTTQGKKKLRLEKEAGVWENRHYGMKKTQEYYCNTTPLNGTVVELSPQNYSFSGKRQGLAGNCLVRTRCQLPRVSCHPSKPIISTLFHSFLQGQRGGKESGFWGQMGRYCVV